MKDTSVEAFESVKPTIENKQSIILKAMERIGRPATTEVIACHCTLNHSQVWKRMSELERAGKVFCTDLKAVNSSGRSARKWQLTGTQSQLF